jgi:squalene-associated FAD-dependent desaturase
MTAPRRVVVVGGGLAGITAAIALRETGHDVVLLEAKPWLGGATCSFTRDDLVVDTGQHIFLRCCAAYQGLLSRLGMTGSVRLQDRFDVTVLRPGQPPTRPSARLRRSALPGPLHMGGSLARYPLLSIAERCQTTRAALAMKRLDPADPAVDGQRLGDWLAARGQSEHARRALWDLFTVSALNIAGDDANLALAATVVQTALLGTRDAADIGVPAIPLGDLHGKAAAEHLGHLGAEVRLGAKVAAIEVASTFLAGKTPYGDSLPGIGGNFVIRLGRGQAAVEADGVVIAVPPEQAAQLIPAAAGPARWQGLGSSPIVNVHVLYDRQVLGLPFAAAVDSPVQWVFDRTQPSGLARLSEPGRHPTAPDRAGEQYLAISVSAADEQVDVPAAKLREVFVPALAELLPKARTARVTDFFVTRERRATFRQVPGCEGLRPPAATALPGLVLAGAWTNTGWPDTMEGAVRSGLNAARELRLALGAPARVTAAPFAAESHPAGADA